MQRQRNQLGGQVTSDLARSIEAALHDGRQVLWLLSGGSAVDIAAKAAKALPDTGMKNVTISLIDERFGPVGHPESVWQQLEEAGFAVTGAKLVPVLNGKSLEETAAAWEKAMREAFETCDYKIGLLGIGPDGHTAGILPHSPASSYSGSKLVFAYQSEAIPGVRPAFERITLTRHALSQLDEIVAPAMGESKREALENLQRELPVDEQPAQILKQAKELYVYNDAIKGESA